VLRNHVLELYIAEWQNDGGPKVTFDTNTKRSALLIAQSQCRIRTFDTAKY